MDSFFQRLDERVRATNSMLCIGLDSDIDRLPAECMEHDNPQLYFNQKIIDATADLAAAYKTNLAFYESAGLEGMEALLHTRAYIPEEVPVIADAKRNDIGNTARHYARAIFDVLGFDAVTVNPYMGEDSLSPFFEYRDRGIFVLCLTSNPGAQDFQVPHDLYLEVAARCRWWHEDFSNVGMVTGAPYPEQLEKIRAAFPEGWFLVPGVGAQGGDVQAVFRAGLRDADRSGLIINVSRSIIFTSTGDDFAEQARATALQYVDLFRWHKGDSS